MNSIPKLEVFKIKLETLEEQIEKLQEHLNAPIQRALSPIPIQNPMLPILALTRNAKYRLLRLTASSGTATDREITDVYISLEKTLVHELRDRIADLANIATFKDNVDARIIVTALLGAVETLIILLVAGIDPLKPD